MSFALRSSEGAVPPPLVNGEAAIVNESGLEAEVVHVLGDIDLANSATLDAAISAAAETGRQVVVNLTKCRYIDSTGLNALWRAYRWLETRLQIVASRSGAVHKVLRITGLGEQLHVIFEDAPKLNF